MITERDLIGQLNGYPCFIVEMMLDRQEEQGNTRDVSVFQKKVDSTRRQGGFDWDKTSEGKIFWSKVINAHVYGEALVKKAELNSQSIAEEVVTADTVVEFKVGDTVKCTEGPKTFERIFLTKIEGAQYPYITVGKKSYAELLNGERRLSLVGFDNCALVSQAIKLTRKDISEGKGVGINPELIEVID